MAIVEFSAEAVSANRLAAVEQYMVDFETMNPWEFSNVDDLFFVTDRIMAKSDRSIEGLWLDGSVEGYKVPKYTPIVA